MKDTKFLKAYCSKSNQYYGLEIKLFGRRWEVVNMSPIPDEEARAIASENIRQAHFDAHENLLPCSKCGTRTMSSCGCAYSPVKCCPGADYSINCLYCKHFEIDYSVPRASDTRSRAGSTVTVQGKEIKVVNFSNVEWTHFDYIQNHEDGRAAGFPEPEVHVTANKQNIEFHGYNISEMNEGVYYLIGRYDDFDIECNVDTTTIQPHPGGCLYINFGAIKAEITEVGGKFFLCDKEVASVGARFRMRLSLTEEGRYSIYIDGKLRGEIVVPVETDTYVIFGFKHGGHYCNLLSHAYMRGIKMCQGVARQD